MIEKVLFTAIALTGVFILVWIALLIWDVRTVSVTETQIEEEWHDAPDVINGTNCRFKLPPVFQDEVIAVMELRCAVPIEELQEESNPGKLLRSF